MSQVVKIELPNGKDYISPSSGKHLADHPMSYLAYAADKFATSDEMIFGMYYEDLLYGIDTSDRFYIIDDEEIVKEALDKYGKPTNAIRNTNVYKELYQSKLDEANGKHVITEEQHHTATNMANIMVDSGVFDEYLNGETQVTKKGVIDTGKYIVENVLVRSDAKMPNFVSDLKTTSAEINGWVNKGKSYGYPLQGYATMELYGYDEFPFIVQRTKGLYDVGVFIMERDGWFFNLGRKMLDDAIDNYLQYIAKEAVMLGAKPENYIKYRKI